MRMKSTIQRSVVGGAFTYGVIETYALGLATVRLAKGGARLTSIPVTTYIREGDIVMVDYTNDVPSARRVGMAAYVEDVNPLWPARVFHQSVNLANTRIPEP